MWGKKNFLISWYENWLMWFIIDNLIFSNELRNYDFNFILKSYVCDLRKRWYFFVKGLLYKMRWNSNYLYSYVYIFWLFFNRVKFWWVGLC